MDAAPLTFQFYSGGVYDDSNCRTNTLNHAMLLVGYGVEVDTGYDYWILKNRLVAMEIYRAKTNSAPVTLYPPGDNLDALTKPLHNIPLCIMLLC